MRGEVAPDAVPSARAAHPLQKKTAKGRPPRKVVYRAKGEPPAINLAPTMSGTCRVGGCGQCGGDTIQLIVGKGLGSRAVDVVSYRIHVAGVALG